MKILEYLKGNNVEIGTNVFKEYNYLIKIEYDGTKYVGWQYQKNGQSIQEKIEIALSKIVKIKKRLIGSGRTDKGVNAYGQYANFITFKKNRKFKKIFIFY